MGTDVIAEELFEPQCVCRLLRGFFAGGLLFSFLQEPCRKRVAEYAFFSEVLFYVGHSFDVAFDGFADEFLRPWLQGF